MAATSPLNLVLAAASNTIAAAWNFINVSASNRKLVTVMIAWNTGFFISLTLLIIARIFVTELTGWGMSNPEKRRRAHRNKDIDYPSLSLAAITMAGALLTAASTTGSNFLALLMASLPLLISLASLGAFGFLLLTFTDTIVSTINSFWVNFFNPFNSTAMTFITAIGAGIVTVQPIVANIIRFLTSLPVRVGQVVIQCVFEIIPSIFVNLGRTLYQLATAILNWVQLGPLTTELPLVATFNQLGILITQVSVGFTECACYALRWVVGGLFRVFANIHFAQGLTNAINTAWSFATRFVLIPVISLTTSDRKYPSSYRSFNLWIDTLNDFGILLQETATYQFDIYIYGGNGTFVEQVNGTLPMPTGWRGYVVRFCQSEWAQGFFRLADFILLPIWQVSIVLSNVRDIPQRNGTIAFQFEETFNEAIFVTHAAGSLINTLGNCTNAPQFPDPQPYGNVMYGASAIVRFVQMVNHVFWGELYNVIFDHSVPGQYLEKFLLDKDPMLLAYDNDVVLFSNATGCVIAYLDRYTGLAFTGLAPAVLIYFIRIPFEFIGYVRGILAGEDPIILSAIDIEPLEESLLKATLVGETFFQFEPGANDITCPSRVTFFCATGIAAQKTLSVVIRIFIVILEVFRSVIMSISQALIYRKIEEIRIPSDIACMTYDPKTRPWGSNCPMPLVEDAYDAACHIGVALGTMLPLDVPCMRQTDRFCHVREFPNQRTQTYSICMGTFLCKVAKIPINLLDIFFGFFNWTINFGFVSRDLAVAILKRLLSFVVFGLLSPICPLAHMADCLFSAVLYSGQSNSTPASDFMCLFTAFITVVTIEVGELLIKLITVFINIGAIILGVGGGDASAGLLTSIIDLVTIIGAVLWKVIVGLLQLALSVLFKVIIGICWAVNALTFGALEQGCTNLASSLTVFLGGVGGSFNVPANENYRKRDLSQCPLTSTAKFANFIDELSAKSKFGSLYTHDARTMPFTPVPDECKEDGIGASSRKRGLGGNSPPQSLMEKILVEHFGSPVQDPEDIPTHMATKVYWEPSSSCSVLFNSMNGTKLSQLGPADKTLMAECIQLKVLAVVASSSYTFLSWLPEDIFYNPWNSIPVLGIKIIRFALVFAQWLVDRIVPPEELFTESYQNTWKGATLKTEFYTTELLPILHSTSNRTAGLELVKQAVKNMTVTTYMKRNYPALYPDANSTTNIISDSDPIFDPMKAFFSFASEFAKETVQGLSVEERSTFTVKPGQTFNLKFEHENETTYMPDGGSYTRRRTRLNLNNHLYDYNNRTELLLELGPDVVRSIDAIYSTHELYFTMAEYLDSFYDYVLDLVNGTQYNSTSTGSSSAARRFYSRRAFEQQQPDMEKGTAYEMGLSSTFYDLANHTVLLYANSDGFWDEVKRGITQRLNSLYASPAYEKPYGLFAASLASIGEFARSWSEADVPTELPPWCVTKAAKILKLDFEQVREQVPIEDCDFYHKLSMNPDYDYISEEGLGADEEYALKVELYKNDQDVKVYYSEVYDNTANKEETLAVNKTSTKRRATVLVRKGGKTGVETQSIGSILNEMFAPENDQAVFAREAIPRIMTSMMDEVWSYVYVIIGNEGTAEERFIRTLLGVHPTIKEYWRDNDPYRQILESLPAHRQAQIAKEGYIKHTDHDVFKAASSLSDNWFSNFTKRIQEAASVQQAFFNEQYLRKSKYYENMADSRAVRNVLLGHFEHDSKLKYQSPNLPFVFESQSFINFTEIFRRECHTSQPWLCEYCYLIDSVLGRFLQQYNYLAYYYTTQYPQLISEQTTMLNYFSTVGNGTVLPARIGNNQTSSPRWPSLHEPVGVAIQLSPEEIANGIDLLLPIYQIIGGRLPNLVPNGTCYDSIVNFNAANETDSAVRNLYYGVLRYIQFDLGIDICGLIDTLAFIFQTRIIPIFNWTVDHIFICNFADHLTCEARNFSLTAGLLVYSLYALVSSATVLVVFSLYGAIVAIILSLVLAIFGFSTFLIITYNWCLLCFPVLPQCFVNDVLRLWTYTLGAACSIFIGMFVSSPEYNANTCADPSMVFTFVNCANLGFTNIFNTLAFAKTAFGTDKGISEFLMSFYIALFGEASPTLDYSGYLTNDIQHANFPACFGVSVLSYSTVAGIIVILGSLLGLSAVSSLASLFINMIIALYGYLKFIRSEAR